MTETGTFSLTYDRALEDCMNLLLAVENSQVQGYTYSGLAKDTGIAETTVRRYLKPVFEETMTWSQLINVRERFLNGATDYDVTKTSVVQSYYTHVISNARPYGQNEHGELVYKVNTSRFNILIQVGTKFGWTVTWNTASRRVEVYRDANDLMYQ